MGSKMKVPKIVIRKSEIREIQNVLKQECDAVRKKGAFREQKRPLRN